MGYVKRNANGEIDGYVAFPNEHFPEQIADDDPEVVAFNTPSPITMAPPDQRLETTVLYDHENRLRAIEGAPPLTLGDFVAKAHSR